MDRTNARGTRFPTKGTGKACLVSLSLAPKYGEESARGGSGGKNWMGTPNTNKECKKENGRKGTPRTVFGVTH